MKKRGVSMMGYGIVAAGLAASSVAATYFIGQNVSCGFDQVHVQLSQSVDQKASLGQSCTNATHNKIYWQEESTLTSPLSLDVFQATSENQGQSQTISQAVSPDNSHITYSLAFGALPSGLRLDAQTGIISGIPSVDLSDLAVTSVVGISASDRTGSTDKLEYVKIPVQGHSVVRYSGGDVSFSMPNTQITFNLWGAAGGSVVAQESRFGTDGGDNLGGPGGFASGVLSPSLINVGTQITLRVGQGGGLGSTGSAFGGGGSVVGGGPSQEVMSVGDPVVSAGGGGGTYLMANGQDLLVAAGGGGAGSQTIATPSNAGAGGGSIGNSADSKPYWGGSPGIGGTATAPGGWAQNVTVYGRNPPQYYHINDEFGSARQGGTAMLETPITGSGVYGWNFMCSGAGGGGHFGGGAGTSIGCGGGGGGSGYADSSVYAPSLQSGSNGGSAPNQSIDGYPSPAGNPIPRHRGGDGAAVFSWGP